jgi:hypothetical protein
MLIPYFPSTLAENGLFTTVVLNYQNSIRLIPASASSQTVIISAPYMLTIGLDPAKLENRIRFDLCFTPQLNRKSVGHQITIEI